MKDQNQYGDVIRGGGDEVSERPRFCAEISRKHDDEQNKTQKICGETETAVTAEAATPIQYLADQILHEGIILKAALSADQTISEFSGWGCFAAGESIIKQSVQG